MISGSYGNIFKPSFVNPINNHPVDFEVPPSALPTETPSLSPDLAHGELLAGELMLKYDLEGVHDIQPTDDEVTARSDSATITATNNKDVFISGELTTVAVNRSADQSLLTAEKALLQSTIATAKIKTELNTVVMQTGAAGEDVIATEYVNFSYTDETTDETGLGDFDSSTTVVDDLGNSITTITGLNTTYHNPWLDLTATAEQLTLTKQNQTLFGSAQNANLLGTFSQGDLSGTFNGNFSLLHFTKSDTTTTADGTFTSINATAFWNGITLNTLFTNGSLGFDQAARKGFLQSSDLTFNAHNNLFDLSGQLTNTTGNFDMTSNTGLLAAEGGTFDIQSAGLTAALTASNLSVAKQAAGYSGTVDTCNVQGIFFDTSFSLLGGKTSFLYDPTNNNYETTLQDSTVNISRTFGSTTLTIGGLFNTLSLTSLQGLLSGNVHAQNLDIRLTGADDSTEQISLGELTGSFTDFNPQTLQLGEGDLEARRLKIDWQEFQLSLEALDAAYTQALTTVDLSDLTIGYDGQRGTINNINFSLTSDTLTVKLYNAYTISFDRPTTVSEGTDLVQTFEDIIFTPDGSLNKSMTVDIPSIRDFSYSIESLSFLPYVQLVSDVGKNLNFGIFLDNDHLTKIIDMKNNPFTGLAALNEACDGHIAPLANKAIRTYLDYAATERKTMTDDSAPSPGYLGITTPPTTLGFSARTGITTTTERSAFGLVAGHTPVASLSVGFSIPQNPQAAVTVAGCSFIPTANIHASTTLGPELLHLNLDGMLSQGIFRVGDHAARSLSKLAESYGIAFDPNNHDFDLLQSELIPFVSAALESKINFSKSFSLSLSYTPYPEMLFTGTGDNNLLSDFSFLSSGRGESSIQVHITPETSLLGSASVSKDALSLECAVQVQNVVLGTSYSQTEQKKAVDFFCRLSL